MDSVVTLEGDTAEESGSGVQIDGNTVTVVKDGTYLFCGTLNGQIVVNTDKKTDVRLILDGVTHHLRGQCTHRRDPGTDHHGDAGGGQRKCPDQTARVRL